MKKWITYTIGILLSLVVLAGVGGFAYRLGVMRGATLHTTANGRLPAFPGPRGFDKGPDGWGPNFRGDPGPGRDGPPFGHDRGRMMFFPPLFGLVHVAILALLLWLGYTIYKNSGWRFVRVNSPPAAAQARVQARPRRTTKS